MSSTGRLYRIKEVAPLFNVSIETLRRWVKAGKLNVVRLPSGQLRIPESEVVRVLEIRGLK
jgi:excisionase family DNA binding protein